jgi:hypothetical protein
MSHIVDRLQQAAVDAVALMREAALRAREAHARAELLRHMRGTAAKFAGQPDDEAVARIAGEWMQAWGLSEDGFPGLADHFRAFTAAFARDSQAPSAASSEAIGAALAALEAALGVTGMTLADQMAFRSECAHGWWAMVVPVPDDLPGRRDRPSVPAWREGTPFWSAGAAVRCGAPPVA